MKYALIALTGTLTISGVASADEISQSYEYALDGTFGTFDSFTFDSFDNQGGTRVLNDVRINLEGAFDFVYSAENQEDYALSTDDWFFDAHVSTTLELGGLATGGIWGAGWGELTADLSASDSVEGSGDDYVQWNFQGSIESELFFIEDIFPAFITNGPGTVEGTLGVFTDLAITPGHQYNPTMESQLQSGTFTLTYLYTTVPAPTTTGLMALCAMGSARRRRIQS